MFTPAFAAIRAANDGSCPGSKVAGGVRRVLARRVRCRPRQIRFHGSDAGSRLASVPADGDHRADVRLRRSGGQDLPVQRFLVTLGFRPLRESKVRSLRSPTGLR